MPRHGRGQQSFKAIFTGARGTKRGRSQHCNLAEARLEPWQPLLGAETMNGWTPFDRSLSFMQRRRELQPGAMR